MATAPAPVDALPDAAFFAAPVCRNCNAPRVTPYCGQCGQKRARRLDFGAVRSEAWQNYRLFELDIFKAAWRLVHAPGVVAREFVFGARARHVHPLKLLMIAIGIQVLILNQTNFLDAQNAELGKAFNLLRAYANWSFSLGIFAIVGASMLVLRRRQPFNLTEHLVVGVYAHLLTIIANIINQLPVLVWRAPAWLAWHRQWSVWPMDVIEALIVLVVFRQFFQLDLRRDGLHMLAAGVAVIAFKFVLVRLYIGLLLKLVLAQLA